MERPPPKNYGLHVKIQGKILNWFGAIYVIQALALGVIWSAAMAVLHVVCSLTGLDPNRKWYDWTGKQWVRFSLRASHASAVPSSPPPLHACRETCAAPVCMLIASQSRLNMFLGGCSPSVVSGLEHLPKEGEAALLCANHASWFDIPLIAQVRLMKREREQARASLCETS